ncbi:cytochrome c peroxidase [Pelagicoccus sp. SDUM812003]|uniref:cytochrome c peroxidase n=1 Tax=Pelagicoccus sp. SDUM812003 TaxID=3041267 RepID=UPI00280FDD29|nr:cytochrome c peroxidase [Pelagicoccus sp. SDUM812003]MDQ8202096.1 cytochrome c peroxidase [Pelagicoccus sp. SDUM812003]
MCREYKILFLFVGFLLSLGGAIDAFSSDETAPWLEESYHSPLALSLSQKRGELYVINNTSSSLSVIDLETQSVTRELALGSFPADAVLSKDESKLYVSCLYDYCIQVVDLDSLTVVDSVKVGYEPYGLTLSQDGERLYVANMISNTVTGLATRDLSKLFETSVARAPRFITELPSKGLIAVTNGMARELSLIDAHTGQLRESRHMLRSSLTKGIEKTDTEEYLIAAGIIAHDEMITMQIERGWINSNGVYVMKVDQPGHCVVVPLDSLINGAANPWDVLISPDQKRLYVTLSGVHEVAFVDLPKLLNLVASTKADAVVRLSQDVEVFDRLALGKRVQTGGNGPRGMALDARRGTLYVANYFTNDISAMNAEDGELQAVIALGEEKKMTLWRRGELLFNDARICQQNYYSCASCHQEDATTDGLNWDLINDGRGNPKNAKSLHDAMDTPPVMWSGVRANMYAGVAAGQRFLGFIPTEENHEALMEYIGHPRRAPNPYLNEDVAALERGKEIFYRSRCHVCHVPPTFSDMRKHDLGLKASFELRSRFYTPSLRESYRTGPYLHHGFAETYEEIFRKYNPDDKHGLTSGLSDAELQDLIIYLKSL